jgi:hypothetical protein
MFTNLQNRSYNTINSKVDKNTKWSHIPFIPTTMLVVMTITNPIKVTTHNIG